MQYSSYQKPLGSFKLLLTPAVKVLLLVNILIFILQVLVDGRTLQGPILYYFSLHWSGILSGHVWQFLTYIFLHGSPVHLLMNMLRLFFIGQETEKG